MARPRRNLTRGELIGALEKAAGNRRVAGELLGVAPATLYRYLERHQIDGEALRLVGGRYASRECLDVSTEGVLLRARDESGTRGEVILRLLPELPPGGDAAAKLVRRVQELVALRHPSLVRVLDGGVDRSTGRPYVVMSLEEGDPLAEIAPRLDEAARAEVLRRVLEALSALHARGLAHARVRAGRILLRCAGMRVEGVTLLEPALVESEDELAGAAPLSPERLLGEAPDPRSDLFELGLVARDHLSTSDLEPLIGALLEPDPAKRPPDAIEAVERLARTAEAVARVPETEREIAFYGRESELEELLAWSSGDGAMPMRLVRAGGGVGKSRFLSELLSRTGSRGVQGALGVCREGQDGLAPVAQILDTLLVHDESVRSLGLRRRYARALAAVAPGLVPPDREDALAAKSSRFHVLDGIASLLAELAVSRKILLAFDDFHSADVVLLDLVWHLARRGRESGVRILAMARPESGEAGGLAGYEQAIAAEGLCLSSQLEPLTRGALVQIAQAELGEARASLLTEQLWRATQGHPLFLCELLRGLARDARVDLAGEGAALPHTIDEAIQTRLAREAAGSLLVLRMIAVAGRPLPESELAALVGPEVGELVSGLRARSLLRCVSGGDIEFAHAFVRDAVLGGMTDEDRRRCHRRWHDHLASQGAEASRLAEHVIAAGLSGERAREILLEAAESLLAQWHYRRAARCFAAALERMEARSPERLQVLERQARAKREARDLEGALGVCEAWAHEARQIRDRAQESRALSVAAACHREAFAWDPALQSAQEAVALAEAAGDARVRSLAHKTLATVLWETWRHREALEHLETCLELVRSSGDERALANSFNDVAVPYAAAGRCAAGLDAIRRSRELFAKIGDPVWALVTESNEALILAFLGHGERAVERTRHMIEELRRMEVGAPVALALENLALLLNRLGDYGGALEAARELLEAASGFARHENRIAGLLAISDALFQLGERPAASEHARLALELAEALGEERQLLYARLARARDLRAEGRLDAAEKEALAVFKGAQLRRTMRQLVFAALELARVALERERLDDAQSWLDEADAPLDVTSEDAPAIRAAILLERARAFLRAGELAIAEALVAEGLGLAAHRGPAEVEIDLRVLMVRLLEERGETRAARAMIASAAERVRTIAGRLGESAVRQRYLARHERASILAAEKRACEETPPAASTPVQEDAAPIGSLAELVGVALQQTGAERGVVVAPSPLTARSEVVVSAGWADEDVAQAEGWFDGLVDLVGEDGPQLVGELSGQSSACLGAFAESGVRSLLALPIPGTERGLLVLDTRSAPSFFDAADLRVAERLAAQAGTLLGSLQSNSSGPSRAASEPRELAGMVSRSPLMHEVFALLESAASSSLPVLILGESGTGKELAARALHQLSARREEAFMSESCVAIPGALLESALFGHEKGAFTGAEHARPGLFELADRGTLLLDEIGELSPELQAKLLRVLQEGEFRRLGGNEPKRVDVRVVSATHRDPAEQIAMGAMRQDLYYRLAAITVRMPALRERPEDVGLLAEHFLRRGAEALGRDAPTLSAGALHLLCGHSWPGNVRELQNLAERLLILESGASITRATIEGIPELLPRAGHGSREVASDGREAEKLRILDALVQSGGHRGRAAALLGMSRATLFRRLKEHGLTS